MNDDLDFRIKFIQEVAKNPCLYDPGHEDYNNKWAMDKVWTQISHTFGEHISDCKSKWRSIRCAYNRTLGSQSRTYYLAEHLRFLHPFLKSKDKSEGGNLSGPEDEESNEHHEHTYDLEITSPEEPRIKEEPQDELDDDNDDINLRMIAEGRSRNRKRSHEPDRRLTSPARRAKYVKSFNRTAAEHYALSLVPFLETMSQRQQLNFQRGVIDLIEKIKFGSGGSQ